MKKLSLLFATWLISLASFAQLNDIDASIGQGGYYGSDPAKGAQFTINFKKAKATLSSNTAAIGSIIVTAPKSIFTGTPTVTVVENNWASGLMKPANSGGFIPDPNDYTINPGVIDGGSVWIFSFLIDEPKSSVIDFSNLDQTNWRFGFSFSVSPAVSDANKFNFLLRTSGNPVIVAETPLSSVISQFQGSDNMLTAAPLSILPVSLADFKISKNGANAVLNWAASSEVNLSYYRLERAENTKGPWASVGQVASQGSATSTQAYSFTDNNPSQFYLNAKNIYYRIVAVDNDGKEKYSQTKWISFGSTGKAIAVYPNPAKEGFYVNVPVLNPADKKIVLNLVNMAGQIMSARQISATEANNYYFDIKTPGVIAGDYMLQVIMDGEILDTKKIVVQR